MIENIFFEKILIIMLASVWVLVLINQLIKIRDQPLNVLFLTKNLHHCKNFRNDLETRKKTGSWKCGFTVYVQAASKSKLVNQEVNHATNQKIKKLTKSPHQTFCPVLYLAVW